MRQTVHVHNRDRSALAPEKALVAHLTQRGTDRLTTAADEAGDLLVSQLHAEANAAMVRDPVGLAEFHKKVSQPSGDIPKDQIDNPPADLSEPVADQLGEPEGQVLMLTQVALEIFSADGADQDVAQCLGIGVMRRVVQHLRFTEDFSGRQDFKDDLAAVGADAGDFNLPLLEKIHRIAWISRQKDSLPLSDFLHAGDPIDFLKFRFAEA